MAGRLTQGRSSIPHVPPPKRHPYDQWSPDARALDLVGDKWTLLIVRDLVGGPRRFIELQRVLPGISTEQLRSRLNRMVADGMLTRMRYREVPPRVDYELTERGRALMPILGELARWGYEWAWSTPRASECVDLGAIFRLAPGLLGAPGANGIRGSVELAVHAVHGQGEPYEGEPHPNQGEPYPNQGEPHPNQGESHVYTLTFSRGRAELRERPAEHADARVAGTTAAWVAAFSPAGARRSVLGLEISGDCQLATQVLEGLTLSAVHRSQDAIRAVA